MNERTSHRSGRARVVLVVLAALAAGFALGRAFHGPASPTNASADGGETLYTCGMHPNVLQKEPGECPLCHMKLTPVAPGGASSASPIETAATRRVRYWIDAASEPPFVANAPGKSPAGRDLVPVHSEELATGDVVTIDPRVQQNMGLRTSEVLRGALVATRRIAGVLVEPEPNHVDVVLRVPGFVETVYADREGAHVVRGAPLFELASPELSVAIEELVAARKAIERPNAGASAASLYGLARRKLAYIGLPDAEIDRLAALERAPATVPIRSPIDGHVTAKDVKQGARIEAGARVYELSSNQTMWIDLAVAAGELPGLAIGERIVVRVDGLPGRTFAGTLDFLHPHFDMETRTARARATLDNADRTLREGMFAIAEIAIEVARDAVLVPREAVIDTGTRRIAFVVVSDGSFEPTRVELGASGDGGLVQVLAGLAPGERVVTSGQFLLDAESRIREGVKKFLASSGSEAREAPLARLEEPEAPAELVDQVLGPYLELALVLGADRPATEPFAAMPLTVAAQKLVDAARGPTKTRAQELVQRAFELVPAPIERQRELFGPLSDAMVAIVRRAPPSRAFGERVYVVHCPMAPGSWLSRDEAVRNPYYPDSMKRCGTVTGSVECARSR
ncbi:MAG: efflux RND transporter periplasmic adaptor subunit [Planctomycetes bacterium]|nr:efflux RND transporter periplasmic adaptor subunit [Planctomycetota bacterium]